MIATKPTILTVLRAGGDVTVPKERKRERKKERKKEGKKEREDESVDKVRGDFGWFAKRFGGVVENRCGITWQLCTRNNN